MRSVTLPDLQASVRDKTAFGSLKDYSTICRAFLSVLQKIKATRIVSPSHSNYLFYQYSSKHGNRITRPLNSHLFYENSNDIKTAFERFVAFLSDLKNIRRPPLVVRHKSSILIPGKSIK